MFSFDADLARRGLCKGRLKKVYASLKSKEASVAAGARGSSCVCPHLQRLIVRLGTREPAVAVHGMGAPFVCACVCEDMQLTLPHTPACALAGTARAAGGGRLVKGSSAGACVPTGVQWGVARTFWLSLHTRIHTRTHRHA